MPNTAEPSGAGTQPAELPPDVANAPAANDNAAPAELPPDIANAPAANDNAIPPGPEANEQVLAATGTDDAVAPRQPELRVIEGGAGDANAPQAMAGERGASGATGATGAPEPAPATTTSGGPHADTPEPTGGPRVDTAEPAQGPRSDLTPEQEIEMLAAEQAADQADPVGLTDVEPGGELVLDLPEHQEAMASAVQAMQDLPGSRTPTKTVAGTEGGGTTTESGWADTPGYEGKGAATDAAVEEGAAAGHEPAPHTHDQVAKAGAQGGSYHGSHAEKQAAIGAPDQPVGVNRAMCADCQRWFVQRAIDRGRPQYVADPDATHVFLPDGRHISQPHPPGTVGPRPPAGQ